MPMSWTEINFFKLKLNWPDNFYFSILTEFYYPPQFVGPRWIWLLDINDFVKNSTTTYFSANTQVTSLYTMALCLLSSQKNKNKHKFSHSLFWVYSTTFHRTWVKMTSKLGFVRKSYIIAWSSAVYLTSVPLREKVLGRIVKI